MTTTPTSGAAIQRYKIGYHTDEWGQRSSTPSGIPDTSGSWVRYEDHIAALAAGQATAAQQGAYAALSESFLEIPDVQDESGINAYYSREVVLECIDAALASHGQAPAPTHEQIAAYLESTGAYVTNDATREAAIAEAIDTDRAKRGQAPDLHPKTSDLVQRFAAALAEKLSAAEKKYGYSDGWASPNWMDECRQHLSAHIAKGDPRDVAAYCAFLWHHGATTASPQAEQQAPTGSEIYVCARKCYNCGHAGINDDHADNAACKSCDWSGPSPEKDHCPDCEKDGTMTAACPMCSCAYIMVADTQVAAPAALNAPQAADTGTAPGAGITAGATEEVKNLRKALVYVAFALHDAPQYMLAQGITLINGDTVRVSRDGWTVEASVNPHRQPAQKTVTVVPLDEARRLFDAGWKAAALFCDREDVVADGIIGFGACPQFEAAFSAAHGIKGGQS